MHKQLEDYLAQITRNLSSLPQPRLDDELKEMREHLSLAVNSYKEEGQLTDTAVTNALADFGSPEEVSINVLKAWKRHLWKNGVKTFWIMEGIWSALTAFQLLFLSPSAYDQRLWGSFWGFTLFVNVSLLLVPSYVRLRLKTKIKAN